MHTRSNPFSTYTFQELCVLLNAEYHNATAWREDRIILLLNEITFRILEVKKLNDLEKEIKKGVHDYTSKRQGIPPDDGGDSA
jgi:hypothetical protein